MQVKRLSEQNEVKKKRNNATEKKHTCHFEAMQKFKKMQLTIIVCLPHFYYGKAKPRFSEITIAIQINTTPLQRNG
jgi:hypothetical protein